MPTISANGLDLAYQIDGDGPETLVLVNGLADDKESWEAQIPAFAERYRVVSFDNRGVGESPTPPGPYTTAQMAEDLAGLVDGLGVERFHLLGVSMGGMIAQEYAIAHADRLLSASFCCTYSYPGPFCLRMFRAGATSSRSLGVGFTQREVILWAFTTDFFEQHEDVLIEIEELMAERIPSRRMPTSRSSTRSSSTTRAGGSAAVTCPSLTLVGRGRPDHLPEALAAAARRAARLDLGRDAGRPRLPVGVPGRVQRRRALVPGRGRRAVTSPPLAEVAGVLDDARRDALERALELVRSQELHTHPRQPLRRLGRLARQELPGSRPRARRERRRAVPVGCALARLERGVRVRDRLRLRAARRLLPAAARSGDADADAVVARHRRDRRRRVLRGRPARGGHAAPHGAPDARRRSRRAGSRSRGAGSSSSIPSGATRTARLVPTTPDFQALHQVRHRQVEPLLDALRLWLAPTGIELDDAIHEYGPGQLEVNFPPARGLAAIDRAFFFRLAVKEILAREGVVATFMTKPLHGPRRQRMPRPPGALRRRRGERVRRRARPRRPLRHVPRLDQRPGRARRRPDRADDADGQRLQALRPQLVRPARRELGSREPHDDAARAARPRARTRASRAASPRPRPFRTSRPRG